MVELLASDFRPYAQDAAALLICGAAFLWGGGPERAVALTWAICFELAERLYQLPAPVSFRLTEVDAFLATVDVVAGLTWITIALYANRNYTLWIAGLQVLAMTAHLARGFVETISPVAYVTMVTAPGWFQLILLAIGVVRHVMRKRVHGPYRDWRNDYSSPDKRRFNPNRHPIMMALGHDFFAPKGER